MQNDTATIGIEGYPAPSSDSPDVDTDQLDMESRIAIGNVEDIVTARQKGRVLAQELGFSMTQATLVATVISELARNIVLYAKCGEIRMGRIRTDSRIGLYLEASDEGPGIANIDHAMMNGYSSSGGLGLGLPGVSQLVDEFDIDSEPGVGTKVAVTMWLR